MAKRNKYYVSLVCPWCGRPMGVVNSSSKKPTLSCDICETCHAKLASFNATVVMIVDDMWITAEIQDASVPIYCFVKGLLITKNPPPKDVPHWEGKYPILPLQIATSMGLSVDMLKTKGSGPVVLNDETSPVLPPPSFSPMMRSGSC